MTTAIILFAHGARDPEWAAPIRRIQSAIRERAPALAVDLAFLEFMAPDLRACAAGLIADGARRIVVQPMFIAQGGHLKKELPALVETLRSTWPDVEFLLDRAIGEDDGVIAAMAEAALCRTGATLA